MSWDFLRRPKWIARHAAVLVLVAAMLGAGVWQLDRRSTRAARNDRIEERQEQPVAPVETLVPAGVPVHDDAVEAVIHRRATAAGTYLDEDTVVVLNRSFNGAAGGWVLTPLDLGDGTAVIVNRGFIGFDRAGRVTAPPAPRGPIRVEGLVQESQQRGSFGPRDPDEGRLETLARVDLPRLAAQVEPDLLPAYLQRTASDPPEAEAPEDEPQIVSLPPPELDDGPHLSYAVQWFIFSAIAAGGYPLLLRRVARDEQRRLVREARAIEPVG